MMVGKYLKSCPVCGGAIKRVKSAYVVGRIVVEHELDADMCTKCGEEFFTAEQVARAQEKAVKLGLLTLQLEEERELKQVGGSLVISIPKAMVKALNLAPREKVKVRMTGEGISVSKTKK